MPSPWRRIRWTGAQAETSTVGKETDSQEKCSSSHEGRLPETRDFVKMNGALIFRIVVKASAIASNFWDFLTAKNEAVAA